jgi:hypothetical protein
MVVAALAENLPHRSRENEFTDGRVDFSVKNLFFAVRQFQKIFLLGYNIEVGHWAVFFLFPSESPLPVRLDTITHVAPFS